MRPTISTCGGDKGETGLYGGKRVSKTDPRIHAYGTVDELNACIGVIIAEDILPETIRDQCKKIQGLLFVLGADLATPIESSSSVPRVEESHVMELEKWGMDLEEALPALQKFILPSGCRAGALLHQARTITRRAERWVVELNHHEPLNEHVLIFINRLSDYFFLAARTANKEAKVHEEEWAG